MVYYTYRLARSGVEKSDQRLYVLGLVITLIPSPKNSEYEIVGTIYIGYR